jgi:hypothetical protein
VVRIAWVVLLALVLLTVAGSAFAYRLISIPVAEVLPEGMYKLEVAAPYNSNGTDMWLPTYRFDGTIYKGLELGIKGSGGADVWRSGSSLGAVTLTVAKETASMPGYGVGVLNLYNSDNNAGGVIAQESVFAGVFKSVNVGLKFPIKLHLLWGTKQVNGVFGGVIIPLSKRFSAAAEWTPEGTSDTKSLRTPGTTSGFTWALGYNQTAHWRLKYANCGGDNAYGIVYTSKWLSHM